MKRADRHAEVVELLPWFVNGTLSETESAQVERHVLECLTCYSALQHERRVRSLVRRAPAARASAAQGFEQLLVRADHESPRTGRRRARVRGESGRAVPRGPAAVAATIVALAAAALIWAGLVRLPGTAPAYETATTATAPSGPALDVVFGAGVSEARMRALLNEIDATIVAGPTEIGRYTIRLEGPATDDELARIVARLMRDERVRFAGRSFIEEAP